MVVTVVTPAPVARAVTARRVRPESIPTVALVALAVTPVPWVQVVRPARVPVVAPVPTVRAPMAATAVRVVRASIR
jgi:hypothetical protein